MYSMLSWAGRQKGSHGKDWAQQKESVAGRPGVREVCWAGGIAGGRGV